MKAQYQLILIGYTNSFLPEIEKQFNDRIADLGLAANNVTVISSSGFSNYDPTAPSVCIYFGGTGSHPDAKLLNKSYVTIPVVDDINNFPALMPTDLLPINGFELNAINSKEKIPALVSKALEALGLLRNTRKLFISYKRNDSRSVALQLYGFLDECGFDVFLDTHSVDKGAAFQDELWHNMADADMLVLLNTDNFVGSQWTVKELAQASSMSIAIMQLVWPDCPRNKYITTSTSLATPIYLDMTDFENGNLSSTVAKLKPAVLKSMEGNIESMRARALTARQNNLIKEFLSASVHYPVNAVLQPEKIITHTCKGKKIATIPTVGVPDVYTSYRKDQQIKKALQSNAEEVWILYDPCSILTAYIDYVKWLDPLPVKFIKISEIHDWLKKC